jgi:creatinine amidohydrolase/Fe(II)-dependent formamide hydrolase-like protein
MIAVEASILSADVARLGEQAGKAAAAGVNCIQIDTMDGCFFPDITFSPAVVHVLSYEVEIKLDVHPMIVELERYLAALADAGADRIIVIVAHQGACPHLRPASHPRLRRRSRRDLQSWHVAQRRGGSVAPCQSSAGDDGQTRLERANLLARPARQNPPLTQPAQTARSEHTDRRGRGHQRSHRPPVAAETTVLVAGSHIYGDKACLDRNVTSPRNSMNEAKGSHRRHP